jgi:hypothetical protein
MWIQEWRLAGWMDGQGTTSRPLVENVRGRAVVVDGEERRRMASVKVGWKRPPWGECLSLWVGRTWP